MLHRKIYQLCCDGREVFLRDQRWIERAIDIEGFVTLYETEEEGNVFLGEMVQQRALVP